jgi:hypothetical protein
MSFPLLIYGLQLTTSTADQPPRRIGADQRDDHRALGFRDAWLAAGARAVSKPIESLLVEAMDALAHRLRVAPQLRSDLRGAKPIPTAGDHPSAHYPVCGSVTAVGQLAHFVLLGCILGGTGAQQLGHILSFPRWW